MRNLKKIVAVLLTVALLASMMVSALAATPVNTDKALKLQAIKLMAGTEADLRLADSLNRIEGLAFAIRAAGKEATALALTDEEVATELAKFTDSDKIPGWGKKYAAYAIKTGITVGKGNGLLGPVDPLSGPMFLVFVAKSGMGYTEATTAETLIDLVVAAKVFTPAQAVAVYLKSGLIRDDAALVLYSAAMTGVNKDGTPLITSLVNAGFVTAQAAFDAGFVATAPAPEALAAEVKVLNLKQIQVAFNKEVNADDAKNTAKYTVKKGSTNYAISGAAIAADNKTVTLTLGTGVNLDNNTTVKVTVVKDFRDAAGVKSAELAYDAAAGDTTFPTFDSVEAKGLKLLRLYFSEPVQAAASNFTVKAGSYTWSVVGAQVDDAGKYVDITLGTNLIEGNVDITVSNAVVDYANLMVFGKTITYNFAKTATAPSATITKAEPGKVVVKFDRPVYGDFIVSHSVAGYLTYGAIKTVAQNAPEDEIEFTFANKIPAGNVTVYVQAQDSKDIKDLYGNKYVAQSFPVTVVADVTAPVVSSQEVVKNTEFKVTFDENIDSTFAAKYENYTLKKADGTAVTFVPSAVGKVLSIKPTSVFADNTNYELTIKAVKDTLGNKSTADIVLAFSTSDNVDPTIKNDTFAVDSDGKIYLYFSEAMNADEMVKKSNYLVATTGSVYASLGSDDTVSAISDRVVLIDMKSATSAPSVIVSTNVTDLAGNKLSKTELQVSKTAIGGETFTLDKAEAIAKDKIKLTFNREVGEFNSNNLTVAGTSLGLTGVAISAVESVSGKEVVIKLDTELNTDAKLAGAANVSVSAITGTGIKTIYGTMLTVDAGKVIADKVAPEVLKDGDGNYKVYSELLAGAHTTDSAITVSKGSIVTITIEYSEVITASSISPMLSYTVAGYTVLNATSGGTSTVTITARADADYTIWNPVVTQVYNIQDANNNAFAGGVSWSSMHK